MIDVTEQINAVRRTVGTRVLEAGEARTVTISQVYDATIDDEWAQFGPGAVGVGWDMGLTGLAMHLSSGRAVDLKEGAAWAASDEGKRFVSLSSQRWCEANVAAGVDEATARAAADRTTAAYTASAPDESTGS